MNEMEKLVAEINKHCTNYYVFDNPTISDKEFDELYDRLVQMEKETGIILPNSPTQRVGGDILQGFEKYPHKERLYSLDKCQTKEALGKWLDDVKKDFPNATFTTEYKFDGLSLVATYKNGIFQSAGTRGNGFVGEDVTAQAKTIKSLPLEIDFKGELIVQGEAMITLSNLKEFNDKAQKQYEEKQQQSQTVLQTSFLDILPSTPKPSTKTPAEYLKNARNAAAGALRNLDPKKTAERKLDWFTYTIHYAENKTFETQKEMIGFLKQNGFNTGTYFSVCKTKEEVFAEIDKIEILKKTEDILLDGVVIRLNQIAPREDFGFTAKFPKWAMAYKFDAEEVTSILYDVEWQVGRTGKLTPIAILNPVELAGASISRATLNNFGDIQKKAVKIGSRVFIRRSNEVIPEILGLAEDLPNSTEITKPKTCPVCKTPLIEIGANLFCPNKDCKDQIIDKLSNFVGKNGFDIEDLSYETIKTLYENERTKLRKFHQIFELDGQDLKMIRGFDDKSVNKLLWIKLEKAKTIPFHKFLYALGIGEVGVKTAKDIAQKFKTLESLKNATKEEILSIRGVGEVVAENIFTYFHTASNLADLDKLLAHGINIVSPQKSTTFKETIFDGKTVVLTGTLSTLPRTSATELLESLNATVTNTISKNTNFLIAGVNAGSKLAKAESLGVQILTEQEFLDIIK